LIGKKKRRALKKTRKFFITKNVAPEKRNYAEKGII